MIGGVSIPRRRAYPRCRKLRYAQNQVKLDSDAPLLNTCSEQSCFRDIKYRFSRISATLL